MADPILTPGLILPVILSVDNFLKSNLQYQAGEKEKVQTLKSQLEETKKVAVEIENHRPNNETVRQWSEKAKQAVSAAEVVIKNLENHKADVSIKAAGKTFFRRLFYRDGDLNSLDTLIKKFERLNSQIVIIMPLITEAHPSDRKAVMCGFCGLCTGLICGILSICVN